MLYTQDVIKAADSTATQTVPTTLTLGIAQDPIFGFYPIVSGSRAIGTNTAFTFYGTFWTLEFLGTNNGFDLYTEFGAGVNFTLADGALNLNPQLGIIGGRFQSGGNRAVIGDGIVPSLNVTYTAGAFSVLAGGVYWAPLRREGVIQRGFADYYIYPTFALSDFVSVGAHYEHCRNATTEGGATSYDTLYHWLGPFLRFTVKNSASLQFAFGADFSDYSNAVITPILRDFYKLSATIPIVF
jgi:hypothetical protein